MSNLYNGIKNRLAEKERTFSWLASQVGKSRQGLKSSLVNGSIRVDVIEKISNILDIPVTYFFQGEYENYFDESFVKHKKQVETLLREKEDLLKEKEDLLREKEIQERKIFILKERISNYKNQVSILKVQLEDKGKIINLLEEKIKILTEVASVYELIKSTKKEDEHFYLDLNDVDSLLNDLGKMGVDLSNKKEKEKFIQSFLEQKIKKDKQKKQ